MDIKQGKSYLTLSDLKKHSIWKFNDLNDLIYPVTCLEDIPENQFDLKIRAKFITPCGLEFLGYLVGIKNIYSITLYIDEIVAGFNRNLPQDYSKDLEKLSKASGCKLSISNFSPLRYITDIDLDGFRNIEGEFDLLKKRTDKERLEEL